MSNLDVTLRVSLNPDGTVAGGKIVAGEFEKLGLAADRSSDRATQAMGRTRAGVESISKQLESTKRQVLGFVAGFVGLQSVGAVVRGVIDNTLRQEKAVAQLEARIRSTGGAAGLTSSQLQRMAADLQNLTTFGDEAVMEMQALLLTFTQIGGSEFQRAQASILDVATAMNTDLKSAALQVGKALNDPVKGVAALAESGIQFSTQQREMINRLVETGRAAEAQGVILDELEVQFGGAAQAARNTLGGALDSLKNALGDLLEAKGGLPELRAAVESVTLQLQSPEVQAGFDQLVSGFVRLIPLVAQGLAGAANMVGRFASEIAATTRLAVQLAPVLLAIWGAQLLRSAAAFTAQLVVQAQQYVLNIALANQLGIAQTTSLAASLKSIGLVNAALGTMVAAFAGWQLGTWLREEFEVVAIAGNALVAGMFDLWTDIEYGAKVAFAALKFAGVAAIDAVRNALADLIDGFVGMSQIELPMGLRADFTYGASNALRSLSAELRTTGAATDEAAATVEGLREEWRQAEFANADMLDDMMAATAATFAQRDAADEAAQSTAALSGKMKPVSAAAQTQAAALGQLDPALRRASQASNQLAGILSRQAAALGGPAVAAALNYRDELTELLEVERELAAAGALSAEQVAGLAAARENAAALFAKSLDEAKKAGEDLGRTFEDVLDELGDTHLSRLLEDIRLVGEELERALAGKGTASVEELQAAMDVLQGRLGDLQGSLGAGIVDATSEALRGMQSLTKNGSDAFKAMQVAIDALALVQGISAILNQGTGDPYSAPVRMAAMAAAIAPLIANLAGSIGAFGGSSGFTDTARIRQERQGTGSVLGDAEAKSESILNAMEITADATSELVGINRGMLRALQQLQSGIDSAGGMLARGAGQAEFTDIGGRFDVGGAFLGGLFGSLATRALDPLGILGGSSRITDQGIAIGGGGLGDLNVQAYQEQQYRRWRFGSRRTREELQPVGEDFASQFQLIVDSITEAVRQGALALGLLPDEIEAALEAFRLEEIRISLKDLSAEEQQAELLAVFSQIFDGLAGDVVPFISQFQRLGEGLGETLVRVATGVQVTREALDRLGFSLDAVGPEQFAQISEGLIELVGGIEEFISGMSGFIDAFAPEARKFELLQSDLNRAFAQAGLEVPATRDGMWALMQSLDATTEAGREQIATLLRLSGTADAYYTMLERNQDEQAQALEAQMQAVLDYQAIVGDLRDELTSAGMSDFAREMRDIDRWAADAREALHEAARAAGMQAAAEEDLALVHQIASQRAAAAIARLRQAAADLVAELYGSPLEGLDAQIREIEEAQRASTANQIGSIGEVGDAARGVYQAQLSALQNIRDWLDSQLLGDTSTLTPEQRLAEARRQFDAAVAAAQGGDAEALQRVTQLADLLLREERDFSASGQQFTDTEAYIRARMQGLLGLQLADPGNGSTSGAGSVGGAGVGSPYVSPELQALYDQRDALLDEQLAAQRGEMLRELGLMVRELIEATGEPLAEVAQSIGLNLTALAADLGINLEELSAETAVSLTALARQLGIDVAELATNVGIELGDLGERQSLLNQALDRTLEQIPEEFRTQLTAPLDAIRSATTDADATAAVEDAEAAIRAMPPAIRELLAPFFQGIGPGPVVSELSTLRDINANAVAQLSELSLIREAIEAIGRNLPTVEAGLESFDVGTAYVPRTGPALIHRGETILPAAVADFARRSGLTLGPAGGDSAAVVSELRALRDENSRGQRALEDRLQQLEQTQRDTTRELADVQRRAYDRMAMGA